MASNARRDARQRLTAGMSAHLHSRGMALPLWLSALCLPLHTACTGAKQSAPASATLPVAALPAELKLVGDRLLASKLPAFLCFLRRQFDMGMYLRFGKEHGACEGPQCVKTCNSTHAKYAI